MSCKGGQTRKQNGDVHEPTPNLTVQIVKTENKSKLNSKPVISGQESKQDRQFRNQNGDTASVDRRKHVDRGRSKPRINNINGDDSSDSESDISSILHNSEWVGEKANRHPPGVEITPEIDMKLSDIQEIISQGALKGKSKDVTLSLTEDLFSSVSDSEIASTADSGIHSLCADSLGFSTLGGILTSKSADTLSTRSSPCSPTSMLTEGAPAGRSRSHSFSQSDGRCTLTDSDRACLEELERGSQLSQEEKELLENSQKELQALELPVLNNNANECDKQQTVTTTEDVGDGRLTLMTPQELESMPEKGLEFEESVGPKEIIKSNTQLTQTPTVGRRPRKSNPTKIKRTKTNSLLRQHPFIKHADDRTAVTIGSNPVVLQAPIILDTSQVMGQDKQTFTVTNQNENEKNAFTICVQTDEEANQTNILLKSSQGQKVYQIQTSDLAQAAAAFQVQQQSITVDNTTVLTASELGDSLTVDSSLSGLSVQDGYLVIPLNNSTAGTSVVASLSSGKETDSALSPPSANFSSTCLDVTDADGKTRRLYACTETGCSKVFKKASKYKIHMMNHDGNRPFVCPYSGCDWAFTTAYKLKRHEESHLGKKDYVCEYDGCGKKFTTVYNLNTHVKRIHEAPYKEACTEPGCEEKFATKRQLDLHMRMHTGYQKTFKCPIEGCNKTFFSPHSMGSHTRVHQRELTCKFEGCGRVFDKPCRLKQHMRLHTGEKPYVCTVESCNWAFSTASKLKRHSRKHTNDRKWVCHFEGCGKAFMRSEHLRGHLVTHTGTKPFLCTAEGCGARFSAKSSLYVHLKKHQVKGEKIAYFCPLDGCMQSFSKKSTLRQHIVKHYEEGYIETEAPDLANLIPLLSMGDDLPEGLWGRAAAQMATATGIAAAASGSSKTSESGAEGLGSTQDQNLLNGTVAEMFTATQGFVDSEGVFHLLVTKEVPDQPSGSAKQYGVSGQMLSFINGKLGEKVDGQQTVLQKKRLVTNTMGLDLGTLSDLSDLKSVGMLASGTESETDATDPALNTTTTLNPIEMTTSRAITFRDPETGAIYIQTQLLQDDPPNPEIYEASSTTLDSNGDPAVMATELSVSLLQEAHSVDTMEINVNPGSEFTGSTINLQDLA